MLLAVFCLERVACVTHAWGDWQVAEVAPKTQKEIKSMAAFCGYKFSKACALVCLLYEDNMEI